MKRPRISSAPIFVQVLALVLFSLVATHLINLGVVLFLPDPPPLGFSVPEAARALKGERVVTARGQELKVRVQKGEPPLGDRHGHEPLRPVLTALLARELGVSADRIRVAIEPFNVRIRQTVRTFDTKVKVKDKPPPHAIHDELFIAVGPPLPPPPLSGEPGKPGKFRIVTSTDGPRGAGVRTLVFPPFTAAVQRPDGQWLVLEPSRPWLSPWQLRTLIWIGLSILLLTPLAWLFARRLARPIHTFAEAAERLGADPLAPPLEAKGPAEVRMAANAFNDMQEKLRHYIEERTAMVAAIAHDLRTPLTRLRFRIEAAPDDVRDKVVADIEQMDGMVSQALAFVRGEAGRGERVKLDLAALADSVVSDMAEMGADASFEGGSLVLEGDAIGLRRMVTNLVENAVKFGRLARVTLTREGQAAVIRVADDGPGLPTEEIERVFEPFHRADPARAPATGGFGLGLSVARSIARAHGGDVTLANREGGGLVATVRLPLA